MHNNSNPLNQGYWFVVREDQSNVIFSSNNFTIQNTSNEERYIVESSQSGEPRQFIQLNETQVIEPAAAPVTHNIQHDDKLSDKTHFWDRNKIKLLLTLCIENNVRNVTKDEELLEDIATQIGTNVDECITKYKNLRRTFIRLLKKRRQGKEVKWVHYNICEKLFNEYKSLRLSVLDPWDDNKIRNLLNLYIENMNRFRGSGMLQKDIWKDIASQIGTTEYNCYHKFKNLKRIYFKWQQRSHETRKPVRWPYYHYFERIYYNYTPSSGQWNRTKTRRLIDAYLHLLDKFRNPKFQKKDIWKEIAAVVGENPAVCDKKFRNMKQTYIKLKLRADSGRAITKWLYYNDFEVIYNNTTHWKSGVPGKPPHTEPYVEQLLTFYIENKHRFRDPRIKKKYIWKQLSPSIGLSPEECDKKFRNLKQTYLRLTEKNNTTGKISNWPYLSYFEKIYGEPNSRRNLDRPQYTDVWKAVQHIHEQQDTEKYNKLLVAMEESNNIQRERNNILLALLNNKSMRTN